MFFPPPMTVEPPHLDASTTGLDVLVKDMDMALKKTKMNKAGGLNPYTKYNVIKSHLNRS